MRKGLLAGSPPFTQTIMLVFTMVVCFMLFMFIGMLLAPLILGISIADLMNSLNNGEAMQNLNLMRYMQTLQGVSLFIIPAFFAAYLFSGNAPSYLELRQAAPVRWFGAVLLLMILAVPCVNLMASLNEMISFPEALSGLEQKLKAYEESARQTTELFLSVDNISGMFFNILMMAVLPALGEELIFRGVLQKILVRWAGNVHVGIIIAGFMFSLMHMQFYGFFPRWLLGVMFGYLLVWSGTLWMPIFAHFVHNSMAVIFSFLIHKGIIPEEIEFFGATWGDIPVTIVTTAVCAWLLWWMYRNRIKADTAAQ
jgi:membrane protease YdiL (CAAX protease family)